jgi:MtN3 and saliva related transmembrane protein
MRAACPRFANHRHMPSANRGYIAVAMSWTLVDTVGMAGAVLTTVCWLPQALKIMRERETRAVSLPATSLFTLGIAFWLVYGLALTDWPLIASNIVTLALMLVIVGLKLRYG